jgi:hypothetical protein
LPPTGTVEPLNFELSPTVEAGERTVQRFNGSSDDRSAYQDGHDRRWIVR